jgi:hypothetical protein
VTAGLAGSPARRMGKSRVRDMAPPRLPNYHRKVKRGTALADYPGCCEQRAIVYLQQN